MILKKKIEQLLSGNFEYEQPPLLFSKEKITMTMKAAATAMSTTMTTKAAAVTTSIIMTAGYADLSPRQAAV